MQVTYNALGYHVINIPDGMQLMFFGRVDDLFVVVVAIPEAFPKKVGDEYEIADKALVAVSYELDVDLEFQEICHGHKYVDGGGMVEWGGTGPCNHESIGFRGPDNPEAFYNGAKFEKVFFTS